MPSLVTLRFCRSTAKDFKELLTRCKRFDGFSQDGDRYQLSITSPNELLQHWSDFMVLATRLPKLSGSSATFMGDDVVPFTPELFYKIQDSLYYCYHNGYQSTSFRGQFCDSDWGCKQLNKMLRYLPADRWQSVRHWYRYGRYVAGEWMIDKGAIFQALKTEAELKRLSVCPVFSLQSIKAIVDQLPDKITIDHTWQVLTRSEVTERGIVDVPYMILPNPPVQHDIEPFSDAPDEDVPPPMPNVADVDKWTEEEINRFLDGMNSKNSN